MINLDNLWSKLDVDSQYLSAIQRDWSEGKVPELPFLVVGQKELKDHISKKLQEIDGKRMTSTVVAAAYGDGKTNVMKYLELYFRKHTDSNVRFVYCRANADQTDMCMFLMQHIEVSFRDDLVDAVLALRNNEDFDPKNIAYEYRDDFAFIKNYTIKLFDKTNSKETVENLVSLGTGRLYSMAMFGRYGLNKLTDFNRREVFVLFMNILAEVGIRVVFAVDELEKIDEKSTKRMTYYFISYRELVDLFGKINGHYVISAITGAVRVEDLCPPLYERIKNDIVKIGKLKPEEDLKELVSLLAELLKIKTDETTLSTIVGKIRKNKSLTNNRLTVQKAASYLHDIDAPENKSVRELLEENEDLKLAYDETLRNLEAESAFSNLSRNFFDPLKYYLEYLEYEKVDDNLLRRDYQAFIITGVNEVCMFLFNDDSKLKLRIEELKETRQFKDYVVFVPNNMSISYANVAVDGVSIRMFDYDPKELFVLLNMFRWNIELQPALLNVISVATNSIFN